MRARRSPTSAKLQHSSHELLPKFQRRESRHHTWCMKVFLASQGQTTFVGTCRRRQQLCCLKIKAKVSKHVFTNKSNLLKQVKESLDLSSIIFPHLQCCSPRVVPSEDQIKSIIHVFTNKSNLLKQVKESLALSSIIFPHLRCCSRKAIIHYQPSIM